MSAHRDPDKIPLLVLPCAIGFFIVGSLIGVFLAGLLQLSLVPFLFRFSPLFTWACTFFLAFYLGRRSPKQPGPVPERVGGGFMWSDRSAGGHG